MTKRMLINATQAEEVRVALVDGQWLYDFDIESKSKEQKKGNIYKGEVTRVEPSLEAVFVNYGAERHGFLPFSDIAPEYLNKQRDENGRVSMKDSIRVGQEVIIQIAKEERGNKGAALTTYVGLAGSFLVLMPNKPRSGGISRRIEADDRDEMREALSQLNTPDKMGVIVRTAGKGRSSDMLQWDLDILLSVWQKINEAAANKPAPFLIHQEGNVVIRALRDYLLPGIGEVLIDNLKVYKEIVEYLKIMRPDSVEKLKYYSDISPLFTRFQIEAQIESAFEREVRLPSGGAIVIDHTEALTSIDINSAKATKGGDIEETALETNCEAAHEIARQLRFRDTGGLIVIDFIDMLNPNNQRKVEQTLRKALRDDRARIQMLRISQFGLLEMSRQRLKPSLGDSIEITCPRCDGQGRIRNIEALALSILRVIEEEAIKDNTAIVRADLPIVVATFLMNEKRQAILNVEKSHNVSVMVLPNETLKTPKYRIERIRDNDEQKPEEASYTFTEKHEDPQDQISQVSEAQAQPAVPMMQPPPPPSPTSAVKPAARNTKASPSLIKRLWSTIIGGEEATESDQQPDRKKQTSRQRTGSGNRRTGQSRGGRRPQRSGGGNRNSSGGNRKPRPSNPQRRGDNKRKNYSGQKNRTAKKTEAYADE